MEPIFRERGPAMAAPDEQEALAALERLVIGDERCGLTLGADEGERVALPETVRLLLRGMVRALAAGQAVRLETFPRELLPSQAAALLGEPRAYIGELIAHGDLPVADDGETGLALIPLGDAMAYKARHDRERRQILDEMVRLNQEMGLYELPS